MDIHLVHDWVSRICYINLRKLTDKNNATHQTKIDWSFYQSSEFSKFVMFFRSDKCNTKVPLYIRFGVKSTWSLYCVYFSRFHWWIWPTDGVVSYAVCCIFHCCYVYSISLYCVHSDIFSYWMQIVITYRSMMQLILFCSCIRLQKLMCMFLF